VQCLADAGARQSHERFETFGRIDANELTNVSTGKDADVVVEHLQSALANGGHGPWKSAGGDHVLPIEGTAALAAPVELGQDRPVLLPEQECPPVAQVIESQLAECERPQRPVNRSPQQGIPNGSADLWLTGAAEKVLSRTVAAIHNGLQREEEVGRA